jgi:hypothetical protein
MKHKSQYENGNVIDLLFGTNLVDAGIDMAKLIFLLRNRYGLIYCVVRPNGDLWYRANKEKLKNAIKVLIPKCRKTRLQYESEFWIKTCIRVKAADIHGSYGAYSTSCNVSHEQYMKYIDERRALRVQQKELDEKWRDKNPLGKSKPYLVYTL